MSMYLIFCILMLLLYGTLAAIAVARNIQNWLVVRRVRTARRQLAAHYALWTLIASKNF